METTDIYESENAPEILVDSLIWWASRRCPNQQYTKDACGVRQLVFDGDKLSKIARERIIKECNEFWRAARNCIRSAKGRCNVSPEVDTDSCHVARCGDNFLAARNNEDVDFFLGDWPDEERDEFCWIAQGFCKMVLKEENGELIFCEV